MLEQGPNPRARHWRYAWPPGPGPGSACDDRGRGYEISVCDAGILFEIGRGKELTGHPGFGGQWVWAEQGRVDGSAGPRRPRFGHPVQRRGHGRRSCSVVADLVAPVRRGARRCRHHRQRAPWGLEMAGRRFRRPARWLGRFESTRINRACGRKLKNRHPITGGRSGRAGANARQRGLTLTKGMARAIATGLALT